MNKGNIKKIFSQKKKENPKQRRESEKSKYTDNPQ